MNSDERRTAKTAKNGVKQQQNSSTSTYSIRKCNDLS